MQNDEYTGQGDQGDGNRPPDMYMEFPVNLLAEPPATAIDPTDGIVGRGGIDRTPGSSEEAPSQPLTPAQIMERWKTAVAIYYDNDNGLELMGNPVAQRWQEPYMHKLADVVGKKGHRVLEIGFGLGMTTDRLQEIGADPHVIIESNLGVMAHLQDTIGDKRWQVYLRFGPWQKQCFKMDPASFDGILYSACHISNDDLHTHHLDFIRQFAYRLLKPGGVFTYANIHSWGELLKTDYPDIVTLFKDREVPHLLKAGFERSGINYEMMHIEPPSDCQFFQHNELIIPIIRKPSDRLM